MARYGDTVVLGTAMVSPEPVVGMDYFPLSIDYEEKFYAAGKISGSRFIKREGRPSDEAVLIGRLIDRPIRPLWPKGLPSRSAGRGHRFEPGPGVPAGRHSHGRHERRLYADRRAF